MANVTQEFTNCKLVYDLTAHKFTVYDQDADDKVLIEVGGMPDNPGGFDLHEPEHYIKVPSVGYAVDFVPLWDNYDQSKFYDSGQK